MLELFCLLAFLYYGFKGTRSNSLTTTKSDDQFGEIYEYFDSKFANLKSELRDVFAEDFIKLKNEINEGVKEILDVHAKKVVELESTVTLLRSHVETLKAQVKDVQTHSDENEQYGRRLCLRLDGIPCVDGERADDVLEKCKSMWEEADVVLPDSVIDRAHRIGSPYNDRETHIKQQSVILRLTTHRRRSMIYTARKKIFAKHAVRVKLDLTKKRYKTLMSAHELVKDDARVNYCYVDINCRLKIKFHDKSEQFFNSIVDLERILGYVG